MGIQFHINYEGIIWNKKEKDELEKLQKEEEDEKKAEDEEQEENKENEENTEETENIQNKSNDDDSKQNKEKAERKRNKKEVLIKNQFNFSERASQTFNEPLRDREVQTEPAPKSVFSQNANPSSIRDEYLCNLLKMKQQKIEEENKKKRNS